MVLSQRDNRLLEECRDREKDRGVAFLADILCKIVEYLESRENNDERKKRGLFM